MCCRLHCIGRYPEAWKIYFNRSYIYMQQLGNNWPIVKVRPTHRYLCSKTPPILSFSGRPDPPERVTSRFQNM